MVVEWAMPSWRQMLPQRVEVNWVPRSDVRRPGTLKRATQEEMKASAQVAASNQRRYLRRVLRKKPDVTVKQFVDRVLKLNNYLARFPPELSGNA